VFGSVVSTVTGVLDRRFLRNSFALSLAFIVLCGIVALAGMDRLGAAITAWQSWPGPTQLLAVAGFIAAVWVAGAVVQSQIRSITQVYEGYWSGPLGRLKRYGEERHKQRLSDLRTQGRAAAIYAQYPLSRKQVKATRLGNILRAAELYPYDRYGADAVLVWPRLYQLLPDSAITSIAQARESLEFLLVLSSLAAAFGTLSGVYLLVVTAPFWLFLLCFWGGLAIAILAYRSSLGTALLYAEVLRSTFDLYRLDVLTAMRLPAPENAADERLRWTEVNRLILRNAPLPQPYAAPPPAPAPANG
jgi:hypothetical protein